MKTPNLKNSDLLNFSTQISQTVRENLSDFKAYGYTEANVEALENAIANLSTATSDLNYSYSIKDHTVQMNLKREKVLTTLRTLAFLYNKAIRNGLLCTVKFPLTKYQKASNKDLHAIVFNFINTNKDDSSFAGFINSNEELFTQLRTATEELQYQYSIPGQLKAKRESATLNRNAIKKEIWDMIRDFSETGKFLYKYTKPEEYKRFKLPRRTAKDVTEVVEPNTTAA